MNEPHYEFTRDTNDLIFTFSSVSTVKTVRKVVVFQLVDEELELYNLALVDVLPGGAVSDVSVSNNQDMPKVLTTVFRIIAAFLDKNMTAQVLIRGSTPARTRLYQMAISKYWSVLEQNFQILGLTGADVGDFKLGIRYDGFVVSKQTSD